MGKVDRFEDLMCWQNARELVKLIFEEFKKGQLAKDFGTCDQFKRAGISVMNNIAEGFSRFHKNEFKHFLDYAQSSASEVISLSYAMEDIRYLTPEKSTEIRKKATETRSQILGLIKYLASK
jgi:four helix bundle protein